MYILKYILMFLVCSYDTYFYYVKNLSFRIQILYNKAYIIIIYSALIGITINLIEYVNNDYNYWKFILLTAWYILWYISNTYYIFQRKIKRMYSYYKISKWKYHLYMLLIDFIPFCYYLSIAIYIIALNDMYLLKLLSISSLIIFTIILIIGSIMQYSLFKRLSALDKPNTVNYVRFTKAVRMLRDE